MRSPLSKIFIVYAIIIVIATAISCSSPVTISVPEVIPETVPEVIIIPDEPDTPEIPEIIEEIIFMMKPIEVYEKYAVDENNKVFGLEGNSRDVIVLKDTDDKIHSFKDFFVKDGTVFFSVNIMEDEQSVTKYYFQTGDQITEDTEQAFPAKPESDFVEMGISPFSIATFDYEGMDTSRVSKDGKPTGFKMIDAYFHTPEGLWFSVPETISIRLKGVYFYPVEGNLAQSPIMSGRIW